jgi:hypothetical protein
LKRFPGIGRPSDKAVFLDRLPRIHSRPLQETEMRNKRAKKIILALGPLQVPSDLTTLIQSKEGREILSWFNLSKIAHDGIRRILEQTYDPGTPMKEMLWEQFPGVLEAGSLEGTYYSAIQLFKNLDNGRYGSGILRSDEIKKDIRYLEKRKAKLEKYRESEFIEQTNRQMLATQCGALFDYLRQVLPPNFTAKSIYLFLSELMSNLHSIDLTPRDIKYLCEDDQKK